MDTQHDALNEDPARLLRDVHLFLLDMDGTVYLGNHWIPGAPAFLERLRETGRDYLFLTNNSSKSKSCYVDKLSSMGLPVSPQEIVTSAEATIDLLQREYSGKRVFLLGNPQLTAEFEENGIVLDSKSPDIVITAFDTSLTYESLWRACDHVRAGLPYLATHPDFNCPTETGYMPDIGAIHAFIEASTGRMPDLVVGKPNRTILSYALARAGAQPGETAIVGDRLYTDIAAGVNAGILPVLVLSGEASPADIPSSPAQPRLVFDSVASMLDYL